MTLGDGFTHGDGYEAHTVEKPNKDNNLFVVSGTLTDFLPYSCEVERIGAQVCESKGALFLTSQCFGVAGWAHVVPQLCLIFFAAKACLL